MVFFANLMVCLLKAYSYSPSNCTGSPQDFYKTCTLQKHTPKVSPSRSALVKKWQIKLGDAGTMDGVRSQILWQVIKSGWHVFNRHEQYRSYGSDSRVTPLKVVGGLSVLSFSLRQKIWGPICYRCTHVKEFIYLLEGYTVIAQLTAQGHLRAFH